jgi:uncharacterized membrane protein YdjX (TVP38/TMEM64 family)
MPQTPMELAAGVIWSLPIAIIIGWFGKQLGSYCCFFTGRYFGKEAVEIRFGASESRYLRAIGLALQKKPVINENIFILLNLYALPSTGLRCLFPRRTSPLVSKTMAWARCR